MFILNRHGTENILMHGEEYASGAGIQLATTRRWLHNWLILR
jgi:hypothetical protein